MKKLKFRHKIGNILHFIRLLETRNHDVSAQTPGVNGQKLLFFCKSPGINEQNLLFFCKTPGVNEQNLLFFYKTPGDNYQISRNSAQERGTIIRIREILLRNGVQLSELAKFCSGTGYNHQNS